MEERLPPESKIIKSTPGDQNKVMQNLLQQKNICWSKRCEETQLNMLAFPRKRMKPLERTLGSWRAMEANFTVPTEAVSKERSCEYFCTNGHVVPNALKQVFRLILVLIPCPSIDLLTIIWLLLWEVSSGYADMILRFLLQLESSLSF